MGVTGLWEILAPTARPIPLTKLALEAFEQNRDGSRCLRIGVDASLWIFHAKAVPQMGSSPFIRTMFFKILKLLNHNILPLFVFDGPNKPLMKRNIQVTGAFGSSDRDSKMFKALLDQCGWEYWVAPGEAEAELAVLSQRGLIDAVLTDDVDALVFGATRILRNPSRTLSGSAANPNTSETKEDYQSYTLSEIAGAKEDGGVGLDQDGMIFLALCSGGDYLPAGIPACGPKIAIGLALAGLAQSLLNSYRTLSPSSFQTYLPTFLTSLKHELSTNSSGHLPNKRKALAASIPSTFPDLAVLEYYVRPAVSPPGGGWPGFGVRGEGNGCGKRGGRGDPREWGRACERWFEWGSREEVGRRMRTLVWRGEVVEGCRGRVVAGEKRDPVEPSVGKVENSKGRQKPGGDITSYFASTSSASSSKAHTPPTPTDPFPLPTLLQIHSTRQHPCTHHTLEYRIEFDPREWTATVQGAMDGTRADPTEEERTALGLVPSGSQAPQSSASEYEGDSSSQDPTATPRRPRQRKEIDLQSSDKAWIPAVYIQHAYPELIAAYEAMLQEKEARKTPKKKKVAAGVVKSPAAAARTRKKEEEEREKGKMGMALAGWLKKAPPTGSMSSGGGKTPEKKGTTSKYFAVSPSKGKGAEVIDISDSPEVETVLNLGAGPSAHKVPPVGMLTPHTTPQGKKFLARPPPDTSSSVSDDALPGNTARRLFGSPRAERAEKGVAGNPFDVGESAVEGLKGKGKARGRPSPKKVPRLNTRQPSVPRTPSPTPTPRKAPAGGEDARVRQGKPPTPSVADVIDLSEDDSDEDVPPAPVVEEEEEAEIEVVDVTPPARRLRRGSRSGKGSQVVERSAGGSGRSRSATVLSMKPTHVEQPEEEDDQTTPRAVNGGQSKDVARPTVPSGTSVHQSVVKPHPETLSTGLPTHSRRRRTAVKEVKVWRMVSEDEDAEYYEPVSRGVV